ncbi:sugar dehydrogenase complex small subunit [Ochrobactrum sp. Marseille-Q0166]|uniref:sugar dehydrogenase complex small subunit n=1 Tax=Ochrobactrum sp. Marseille-Q0166 TaxID=2761105 RepID=UPI001655F6C6|nr:sugar dehydrogenase complex small subunit [Ochrobactrum sp. Marseille-Q0166]MBC8718270.1 sorbitol dehydrogenase [Ochrobactrum sp. Marseille-Q0166]
MPVDNFQDTVFGRQTSLRSVLRGSVAIAALAAIGALDGPLSASATDETQQDFMQLSTFLTGHDLDPVLGSRYFAALQKRNRDLVAQMNVLSAAIKENNVANMDAFLEQPSVDPKLMETATKIVSAWYLGIVGEPEDAELIACGEALIYRPTRNILGIPTYGPGPDAWGPKPDTKI